MKYKIIVASLLVIVAAVSCFFIFKKNPVETKAEAVSIATKVILKKQNLDLSEYDINARLLGDAWLVYYTKRGVEYPDVLDGGFIPEVYIDKSNGKILHYSLGKNIN